MVNAVTGAARRHSEKSKTEKTEKSLQLQMQALFFIIIVYL